MRSSRYSSSILFLFSVSFTLLSAQRVAYKKHTLSPLSGIAIEIKDKENAFQASIYSVEAPNPDGNDMKAFLASLKRQSALQFPTPAQKKKAASAKMGESEESVSLGKGLELRVPHVLTPGDSTLLSPGMPNDNTLAVSRNGYLLLGYNSRIVGYDLQGDSLLLGRGQGLSTFSPVESPTNRFFDPKLVYDQENDRFILVFLKDSEPEESAIIVCFSSTENPKDPWYSYSLPGNPLQNNRWFDFPTLSFTEDYVYISGNLIVPGEPWQIGFDGSIVYKISKSAGYTNGEIIPELFSDIRYGDQYIRNLHLVKDGTKSMPHAMALSNRNFSLLNDTIFVLDFFEDVDSTQTIDIRISKSDLSYGVPPNGRQADTDLESMPEGGLQTNDARVLAAKLINGKIQFVSNSIQPSTGLSCIYHGVIRDLEQISPLTSANYIDHPTRDFGYPNIVATGKYAADDEVMIAFNYTSPDDFPGIAAVYMDNEEKYSSLLKLRSGDGIVDRLQSSDGYERWGDYFGLQRSVGDEEIVHSFGYYGGIQNKNRGYYRQIAFRSASQEGIPLENSLVYPNPVPRSSEVYFPFSSSTKGAVKVVLSSVRGTWVEEILYSGVKEGRNVLTFDTGSLSSGTYFVRILSQDDGKQLYDTQFVVQ